jgi:phosphomannomutase / phosphoglucomutase
MSCYKTCDIRGKYPDELNEALFYHFGQAIALKFLAGCPILVGCDVRPSSVPLKQSLVNGLVDAGIKVFDAGRVPTPVVYFGKRMLGVYAAAIVTGSHNPPEENGLKLLLGRYPATAGQLRSLKPAGSAGSCRVMGGSVEAVELGEAYVDSLIEAWGDRIRAATCDRPLTFVLDPGNGAWALLASEIFRRLRIDVTIIHAQSDGRFPNRSPDCAAPGSLRILKQEIRGAGAAAGVAWDGDGDRVAVCDETGTHLSTEQLVLLLLPHILKNTHQEKVLYDVKMSKRMKAAIEAQDAIPVVERSAHCFLETRMITDNCLFGSEYSGHLFFRDLGGGDDGMHAALLLADFLLRCDRPLSELLRQLPELFITPDLRIPGGRADFMITRKRLRAEFPYARLSHLDGIKVETPGGWILVRPSVSEDKLSFRFEGETPDELNAIIEQVLRLLPELGAALQSQLDLWRAARVG